MLGEMYVVHWVAPKVSHTYLFFLTNKKTFFKIILNCEKFTLPFTYLEIPLWRCGKLSSLKYGKDCENEKVDNYHFLVGLVYD